MPADETRFFSLRGLAVAAFLSVALAIAWIATLPTEVTWGWDESMHVVLPAARMREALLAGEFGLAFDALLSCAQYPFVQPVLLAVAQGAFGASEHGARSFVTFEWCATLFGLFVLTRIVVESLSRERRWTAAKIAPWLAFACAASSPLALGFAGTLFLEIPSACASVWALVAWLWLWRAPTRNRALLAGTLVTIAFFTKWNYGLLLVAGLGLDLVLRLLEREHHLERARVLLPLCAVPVVALVWWFLLPLPGGWSVAAEHRAAFVNFLGGNQDLASEPQTRRAFYATCLLASPPRLTLLILCGFVTALWAWREPALRTLIGVFLVAWVPVWIHPFFQDRFLLPAGVFSFVIAAIGITRWFGSSNFKAGVVCALLLFLAWLPIRPGSALDFDTRAVAESLGVLTGNPATEAYVEGVISDRVRLRGGRTLPSGGLERGVAVAMIEAVARELSPTERFGWIGVSQEMSPAALHLGLLARGGSRERFLRDADTRIDLDYFADPHADAAAVRAFADGFDVIFVTDPSDLKNRRGPERAWAKGAAEKLLQDGAWTSREIGRFAIARPLNEPLVVTLFACRRKK